MANTDKVGTIGMGLSIISVISVIAYFLLAVWGYSVYYWASPYTFFISFVFNIIGLALSLSGYKETRSKYGLVGLIIAAVVLTILIFVIIWYCIPPPEVPI